MLGEKKSIAIAGNLIADVIKRVDDYPRQGMMAYIADITYAVGGCVPNTAINLTKIDRSIPVSAYGKVGTDENGRYMVGELMKHGIHTEGITYTADTPTSFCDVVSTPTGERTFFHKKGANAEFSPADIPVDDLDCALLHIGYLLLMDAFDAKDKEYGTVLARFLHSVQKRGIKTSIDVVSDSSADYGETIIPALRYCNYAIMNELEGCRTFGLEAYDEAGRLHKDNIRTTMDKMADCGVADKVILHSKKRAFLLDAKTRRYTEVPSLNIPKEAIKGGVGAGDAFCAGCLYGLYHGYDDRQLLEFATAAAACSLFAANAVGGMRSKNAILDVAKKYGRLPL